MYNMSNNREYARLHSPLSIKVILEDGTTIEGQSDNIGFGGVKLQLPIVLTLHQKVKLLIIHDQVTLEVRAQCIWITNEATKPNDYCAGFTFLDDDLVTYEKLRDILNQIGDNTNMEL